MTLSFGVMLGFLQRAIAEIKDPRLASNATRYSIKDRGMSSIRAENRVKRYSIRQYS